MFEVGPWGAVDTNGDGFVDTLETRAAARKVYGLTPLSEEARTVDQSWTLNVADNVKDQFTDEISLNVEREVARSMSVSVSYIYKHSGNLFANVPINRETGQEWEYDRVPFTTLTGQTVMLYSIKQLDYNQDGVIDNADVAWIGDNGTSRVQNMPTFDGINAQRNYHGLQFVVSKRYSDRWQALGRSCTRRRPAWPAAPCARLQRRGPHVLRRQLDGHASTRRSTTSLVRCPSRRSTSSSCRART
jgi:hypothetical protein